MQTRYLLFAAALLALASPLSGQAPHPDFTGTWVLDSSRTQADGPLPAPVAATYVVAQVGDSMAVGQRLTTVMGEQAEQRKVWKVDGKAWANSIMYAGTEVVLYSTLRWDGGVLAIHTTAEYQGSGVEQVETWTLSGDGRTLTQATTTNVNGDYYASVTLVFGKR